MGKKKTAKKKTVKHNKHHAKPVRKRHISLTSVGVLLLILTAYLIGINSSSLSIVDTDSGTAPNTTSASITTVRSSKGFKLPVDRNIFDITGTEVINGNATELSGSQLGGEKEIVSLEITPTKDSIFLAESPTSKMTIEVGLNQEDIQREIVSSPGTDPNLIVAGVFSPNSNTASDITIIGDSTDRIANIDMHKRVYKEVTELPGELKQGTTYSVHWSGLVGQKPVSIRISGLIGGSSIPSYYFDLLDTLEIEQPLTSLLSGGLVPASIPFIPKAGAQESKLDDKYLSDSVSPSVVKVYHGFCGELSIAGFTLPESCTYGTGSGFIISEDGYIATNGHVAIKETEDIIVEGLLNSSAFFVAFLTLEGFSEAQILQAGSSTNSIAAIVSTVYDAPESRYTLNNEKRAILVSLGSTPPEIETPNDFFADKHDDSVVEAKLIDSDYNSEDIYSAQLSEDGEFTASDVALLKADLSNAPILDLATELPIQNESLVIVGFPGDAENSLVSNEELITTTTAGTVSSVRNAKGSDYKLIQSDADASRGNSGGPAFNANGEVIGLLTYRFKNAQQVDAAKSYIRDIADLIALTDKNDVTLASSESNETNSAWLKGLSLFSESRLSKANVEFDKVQELYPDHRLVASYIARADKGIANGEDVKDFPILIVAIGGVLGLTAVSAGVFLIRRQHKHHRNHVATYGVTGSPAVVQTNTSLQQQQAQATAPQAPAPSSSSPTQQPQQTAVVQSQNTTPPQPNAQSSATPDQATVAQQPIVITPDKRP